MPYRIECPGKGDKAQDDRKCFPVKNLGPGKGSIRISESKDNIGKGKHRLKEKLEGGFYRGFYNQGEIHNILN